VTTRLILWKVMEERCVRNMD